MDTGTPFDGDYRAAMKGDFLAAVEFGDETPTFTIRGTETLDMEVHKINAQEDEGAAKTKTRLIVYFEETRRGWVMNSTNAQCLAALFTTRTSAWWGHKVTLCAEMVQVGPKKDLGIRVKGTPEITAPLVVEIKLPRRKAFKRTLQPTGAKPAQQQTTPADKDLQTFRTAVIAATKRDVNPWTQAQITFALESGGAKTTADVPVDRRPAFLELIQGAPPVAPTPEPTTTEEGAD